MNRNDPITLAEVLEIPPGDKDNPSWVNGVLTVAVSDVETKQSKSGNSFVIATFSDPDNPEITMSATMFGRKVFPFDGQVVSIDCQGVSVTAYKDEPQLTVGSKAKVNKVGQSAPRQAPAQQRQSSQGGTTSRPSSNAGAWKPEGITVGACMNKAVDAVNTMEVMPGTLEWAEKVHTVASDLLRISRALCNGNLAPSATQRAEAGQDESAGVDDTQPDPEPDPEPAPAPQQRQPARNAAPDRRQASKPQPGPDGSVDVSGAPSDVPF